MAGRGHSSRRRSFEFGRVTTLRAEANARQSACIHHGVRLRRGLTHQLRRSGPAQWFSFLPTGEKPAHGEPLFRATQAAFAAGNIAVVHLKTRHKQEIPAGPI